MNVSPTTRYADIVRVIHNTLDRDGQHEWDETDRLTDVLAPAVWNEISLFPVETEQPVASTLAALWREEEITDLDVDCPQVDYEATAAAVLTRLAFVRDSERGHLGVSESETASIGPSGPEDSERE